jgi:hypothetical protein
MEPLIRNGLYMGLFRKKRKVEGWDDSVAEVGRLAALKESFQNSNRAWLVVMIGVILLGLCLIIIIAKNEQFVEVKVPEPLHKEHGVYDDDAHRRFITEFNAVMLRRGIRTQMVFQNSGRVKIVVPVDTSNDDVEFVSAWAARAVNVRFHTAPWVYAYTQDNDTPPHEKYVALTQWVARRNDFVVTMVGSQGDKQSKE